VVIEDVKWGIMGKTLGKSLIVLLGWIHEPAPSLEFVARWQLFRHRQCTVREITVRSRRAMSLALGARKLLQETLHLHALLKVVDYCLYFKFPSALAGSSTVCISIKFLEVDGEPCK